MEVCRLRWTFASCSVTIPNVTTPTSAIGAHALHKSFGNRKIIRGLSLEVYAGETVGLLGGNGAGKSTLLRILGGTTRPTSGEVTLFGTNLHGEQARQSRARVGFLGHESMLYRDLGPRENLEVFASLYGKPTAPLEGLLRRVGLATVGNRPVRTLSRGMLQRLALARATLHEPDLLLLDEPFTGLDESGAALLRQILRDHAASHKTTLMISHALPEISALCDRVWILDRGTFIENLSTVPDPETLREIYQRALARNSF